MHCELCMSSDLPLHIQYWIKSDKGTFGDRESVQMTRLLSPREIVVRIEIISYGTYGVYNNGSTVDCFFWSPILNIHEGS